MHVHFLALNVADCMLVWILYQLSHRCVHVHICEKRNQNTTDNKRSYIKWKKFDTITLNDLIWSPPASLWSGNIQSLVTIQELAISPLVYPCLAKLPLNIFQVLRFLLYLTDWTASKVQKQYEKTIQRPRLGQQYGGSMHGCILANRSKTHCGTKIN